MFRLDRPLIILDVETTGLDRKKDRIIEIAVTKLYPNGGRTKWSTLVDPGEHIPAIVSSITGLHNEDLERAPKFEDIADKIGELLFIPEADVGGYVVDFDLDFIRGEFKRLGRALAPRMVYDAKLAFEIFEPFQPRRNLSAALEFYVGRTLEGAHRARVDVDATLEVIEAQASKYNLTGDLRDVLELLDSKRADFIDPRGLVRNIGGRLMICFGSKIGQTLSDVVIQDPDYANYLASNFGPEIRSAIEALG